jgi:manganese/zinc/iron transport system substrate-binding protein
LATIPKERRVLVTAHDAFRYFGRAYDVEVRGIQGISTDSEAGVRQVKELVDFLVERKIKAVFVETSVSDQNIRSLLEGCRARGHEVVIGGSLYSDAMGAAGTPEATYEGMVRHNVETIVNALK